ncbi:hypothetical protein [Actinoplanes sp. GCM10030250]|uniref:hypothetical protein n=1 Tax=Actinoplanes sp. GCM10030250 TaxID=3273376 RepID=UPI00361F454E
MDSLESILACDELGVDFHTNGPQTDVLTENPETVSFFVEFDDVIFDPSLLECNIWFIELSCRWRTREGSPELGGEFRIRDLYDSILLGPPQFTPDTANEQDLAVFSELRVIDFPQHAGTGTFAAMRLVKDVTPLPLWYYDPRLTVGPEYDSDLIPMELTYCGYLEALLLTKGVFGWQFLFTDVSLRGVAFRETVARLRRMLDLFPVLFPEHDYADLATRLEARL